MSGLKVQVDVWGGDLHQRLVRSFTCESWAEVAKITETECEAGNLVNVLCLDFKTPPDRQSEVDQAMKKLMKGNIE